MELLPHAIEQYVNEHTSQESDVLKALDRETHQKILHPRMLSGHLQGRLLSMLSHMIKPKNILEIGTYTGYSALCFAEGLQEGGRIDTIDRNEELKFIVDKYIQQSGFQNVIHHHLGQALDVIKKLNYTYDIVFIDADKENYINYYDAVFEKVAVGGYIIADNVLWSGKILDKKEVEKDLDTRTLVAYNKKITEDSRVENVLLPIRDGLMVARKISN